jgi:hypothetical protein
MLLQLSLRLQGRAKRAADVARLISGKRRALAR